MPTSDSDSLVEFLWLVYRNPIEAKGLTPVPSPKGEGSKMNSGDGSGNG